MNDNDSSEVLGSPGWLRDGVNTLIGFRGREVLFLSLVVPMLALYFLSGALRFLVAATILAWLMALVELMLSQKRVRERKNKDAGVGE